MATVLIEVVAGGETMSRLRNVTGQHLVEFVSALRQTYRLSAGLTDVQVLEFWADMIFIDAKALTRVAKNAAATAAVTDIEFTP